MSITVQDDALFDQAIVNNVHSSSFQQSSRPITAIQNKKTYFNARTVATTVRQLNTSAESSINSSLPSLKQRIITSQKLTRLPSGHKRNVQSQINLTASVQVDKSNELHHIMSTNFKRRPNEAKFKTRRNESDQQWYTNETRKSKLFKKSNSISDLQQQSISHTRSQSYDVYDVSQNNNSKYTNKAPSQKITINDITPELSAQIIRFHILPMFDKNSRAKAPGQSSTIYNELKLSEQLELELNKVRQQVQQLIEHQDSHQLQNTQLTKKLAFTLQEVRRLRLVNRQLKQKGILQDQIHRNELIVVQKDTSNRDGLQEFLNLQQVQMQHTSTRLIQQNQDCERMRNEFQYMQHDLHLINVQREVVDDATAKLFEVLKDFPTIRTQTDKYKFDKQVSSKAQKEMIDQFQKLQENFAILTADRDQLQTNNKDLITNKINLETQRIVMFRQNMETIRTLEAKLDTCNETIKQLENSLSKTENALKTYEKECVKLKARFVKIKSRKMIAADFQTCKICSQEFVENENFNWSCRTHTSDFSGEMWWCCGKTSKEALGCKFNKHIIRNDEIEEEELAALKAEKRKKNQKCFCCKEYGHEANKCIKDPNYRSIIGTSIDKLEPELIRLSQIQNSKRLHANTVVQTTHFLKKCAIFIPKQPQIELNTVIQRDEDRDVDEEELQRKFINKNPFKRGAMAFEDYNYSLYNPYILVENVENTEQRIKQITKQLSEEQLTRLKNANYQHDLLGQKADDLDLAQTDQINNDVQSSKSSKQPNAKSQAADSDDEVTPSVFFSKRDIREIKNKQMEDTFKDLLELRRNSSSSDIQTKIDIRAFTNVTAQPEQKDIKKKKFKKQIDNVSESEPEFKSEMQRQFEDKQKQRELIRKERKQLDAIREKQFKKFYQEVEEIVVEKTSEWNVQNDISQLNSPDQKKVSSPLPKK